MPNPSEADGRPREPVQFGNHELAELYARDTIGYAHFGQQAESSVDYIRKLLEAVDGERGEQIAMRIISDFEYSGSLITMAVTTRQRTFSFDSASVRQELSAQIGSFLAFDEGERRKYLAELQKEKEKAQIEDDTSGY